MSTSNKLTYLNETKSKIKDTINLVGANITTEPFRQYADKLYNKYIDIINNGTDSLYDAMPKVTGTGTELSLQNTANAPMRIGLSASESTQETTDGYNLLDTKNLIRNSFSVNGLNFTNNGDGTFSITGTSTNVTSINVIILNTDFFDTTKTYRFYSSKDYDRLLFNLSIILNTDKGTKYLIANTSYNFANYDVTSITDARITFYCDANRTINATNVKLMITESGSIKDYEPYTGGIASPNPDYPQQINVVTGNNTITIEDEDNTLSQTFPLSLGTLELAKIGDYKDEIFQNTTDSEYYDSNLTLNGWYKKKRIKKIVLDGTENWAFDDNYNGIYEYSIRNISPASKYEPNKINAISNAFKGVIFNNSWTINNVITIPSTADNRVRIMTKEHTSLTDFKNFIVAKYSNNQPIIVYYVLANPTYEKITDTTLISQLNAIKNAMSYDDETNISQTNANRPFILDVNAIKKSVE